MAGFCDKSGRWDFEQPERRGRRARDFALKLWKRSFVFCLFVRPSSCGSGWPARWKLGVKNLIYYGVRYSDFWRLETRSHNNENSGARRTWTCLWGPDVRCFYGNEKFKQCFESKDAPNVYWLLRNVVFTFGPNSGRGFLPRFASWFGVDLLMALLRERIYG